MARDKCDPIILLTAVVDRLRSVLSLNESNCYWTLNPLEEIKRGTASRIYLVSPLSGQFDQGMMDGGGREQMTANGGFAVTIRTYEQLDEAGRDNIRILDRSEGLVQAATDVLSALSLWDVADSSGNPLLRDLPTPGGYEFGKDSRRKAFIQIGFNAVFDWDLSANSTSTTTTTTTAAP